MAGPTHSRLTLNHPSKNNSAPCTCLFLHDCIQEPGYRNIRCCINGYKPKALAKNLNNCSATGARWSECQNYSKTFSGGLSSFSRSLCNRSMSRFVPQKSFIFCLYSSAVQPQDLFLSSTAVTSTFGFTCLMLLQKRREAEKEQFLLAGILLANFSPFHSEKDCHKGANVSPDPLQIFIVLYFFVEEGSEQMQ